MKLASALPQLSALAMASPLFVSACDSDPATERLVVSHTRPPAASVAGGGGQTVHAALCRPCRNDSDCGASSGATCVARGDEGSFCATACGAGATCPSGYTCDRDICTPVTGQCGCAAPHLGAETDCAVVVAGTRCAGSRRCEVGGLGVCSPAEDAPAVCRGEGDDCDGVTDAVALARVGQPCDGGDDDECLDGQWICNDGAVICSDDEASVRELCNTQDDDCDGLTDEDFTTLGSPCDGADADQCTDGVVVCDPEGFPVCDDDEASIVEICDRMDNDCNGLTDDGIPCTPETARVCYPGTTFDYSVCLDLVAASTVTDPAYDYPASNDARYRAPDYLLDLQSADGSLKLAANFALNEFMQTAKGRWAVYRPLTVAHWQRIRSTLGVPLYVNSGYRSPGYNDDIDGAATFSRHMYGDAADVTAQGAVSLQTIVNACNTEGADYVQLYTTHVHCDWRDEGHSNDFWLAVPVAFRPAVSDTTIDPWERLWGDIELETLGGDTRLVRALWGDAFDEGEPWVSWEVEAPGALETQVIEAETEIVVPAGSVVRWRIGGLVEGQLEAR